MIIRKRTRITGRMVSLPAPTGSQVTGAMLDEHDMPKYVELTVDTGEKPVDPEMLGDSEIRVMASFHAASERQLRRHGLEIVAQLASGQGSVYVYRTAKKRLRRAMQGEFCYMPLERGLQHYEFDGEAFVNFKCPTKIENGRVVLVYKTNLRKKNKTAYIMLVRQSALGSAEATSLARKLCDDGRMIQLHAGVVAGYDLYVENDLIPPQ